VLLHNATQLVKHREAANGRVGTMLVKHNFCVDNLNMGCPYALNRERESDGVGLERLYLALELVASLQKLGPNCLQHQEVTGLWCYSTSP